MSYTRFLLNSVDAVDFVERATAAGLKLADVEGFLISDAGAFAPRQDFSNDAADWCCSPAEFLHQTILMMASGNSNGISFQVVFEDE